MQVVECVHRRRVHPSCPRRNNDDEHRSIEPAHPNQLAQGEIGAFLRAVGGVEADIDADRCERLCTEKRLYVCARWAACDKISPRPAEIVPADQRRGAAGPGWIGGRINARLDQLIKILEGLVRHMKPHSQEDAVDKQRKERRRYYEPNDE